MKFNFFAAAVLTAFIPSFLLTACSDNDVDMTTVNEDAVINLNVSVNVPTIVGRSLINDKTLPDASSIGISLTANGGGAYHSSGNYINVKYTAEGTGPTQTWKADNPIKILPTEGTAYAYYPYDSNVTDITDISVSTATQEDYMYATPVEHVTNNQPDVALNMNHALTAVRIMIAKGDYIYDGNLTAISVKSNIMATGAKLNAITGKLSSHTGQGTAFTATTNTTITSEAQTVFEKIAVPIVETDASLTIEMTIDGNSYTVNTPDIQLEQGKILQLKLVLNTRYANLTATANVSDWNPDKYKMEFDDQNTGEMKQDIPDGVHYVGSDGKFTTTATADCIGVLLVNESKGQQLMIEKKEYENTSYKTAANGKNSTFQFYWGGYGTDQDGIPSYSNGDDAKADMDGKSHSEVLKTVTSGGSSYTSYATIGAVLNAFLASEDAKGYDDWYIPSLGQLNFIYENRNAVDNALSAIGGTTFGSDYYWSSSECSSSGGWIVSVSSGNVYGNAKNDSYRVRFVRDF